MLFCVLRIQDLATLTLLVSWRMALGVAHFSQNHPRLFVVSCPPPIFTDQHIFFLFYCNSRFATGHNSRFYEKYKSDHQGSHGPGFSLGA